MATAFFFVCLKSRIEMPYMFRCIKSCVSLTFDIIKKTISHGLFAVALGTSILAFYEFQILNWLFAGWQLMNLCAYKSMCDCVWVFYYFDVFAAALLFKKKRHYFKSKQVKLVQFQRNIKRKRLCFFFHL